VSLSRREIAELTYLADQVYPIWGGHLHRGQPQTDPLMQRWLALGLIVQVRNDGYCITGLGRAALAQEDGK